MKKSLKLFLICLTMPLSIAVSACEKSPDVEIGHVYNGKWHYNSEEHWQDCIKCYEMGFKANHTWANETIVTEATETTDGLKTFSCSVCGAKKEEIIPHTGGGGSTDEEDKPLVVETDDRWNVDFSKYGYAFRDSLAELINKKQTKTATKSSCLSIGQAAAKKGDGKFVPFYHGSDYAVSTSVSCNREHTWPDSRGGGSKNGGSNVEQDPFMLRPTLTSDNSGRGNMFYGIGSNQFDPKSYGFEPARGECARIIFYTATKYGKSNNLWLSNNPNDTWNGPNERSMGTLKYLVEWNRQYPVTEMEVQINDYLDKQGYGRNPFVDHPEYAEFIWDKDGVRTSIPDSSLSDSDPGVKPSTGDEHEDSSGTYTLIDAIDDINNASAYIVSSNDGTTYTAMTSKNTVSKDTTYSWYFQGSPADIKDNFASCDVGSDAQKFEFKKQQDGTYTIKTPDGKSLYSYIDGSHYSIGLKQDVSSITGSPYWEISKDGNGYYFRGKNTNVYLEYYISWCGYNSKPTQRIYLYK